MIFILAAHVVLGMAFVESYTDGSILSILATSSIFGVLCCLVGMLDNKLFNPKLPSLLDESTFVVKNSKTHIEKTPKVFITKIKKCSIKL